MLINKNIFVWSFVLFVSAAISCKNKTYKDDTSIFKEYLQNNYNLEIPEKNEHYYLLSNSFVCKGCVVKYLHKMNTMIKTKQNHITLITTIDFKILSKLSKKLNVIFDRKGNLDYENLNISNLTIIHTAKGKIVSITNYGISDSEASISDFEKIIMN